MLTLISGGQTGVDQAALKVAHDLGFPTSGVAPLGYRTDDGPNLALRDVYGLKESPFTGYRIRTVNNVHAADATIWFGDVTSPGGQLTRKAALHEQDRRLHYCWIVNPTAPILLAMLQSQPIQILNVAGNRLRINPSATTLATEVLTDVLTVLRAEIR